MQSFLRSDVRSKYEDTECYECSEEYLLEVREHVVLLLCTIDQLAPTVEELWVSWFRQH